jgi:hypothetical protein
LQISVVLDRQTKRPLLHSFTDSQYSFFTLLIPQETQTKPYKPWQDSFLKSFAWAETCRFKPG